VRSFVLCDVNPQRMTGPQGGYLKGMSYEPTSPVYESTRPVLEHEHPVPQPCLVPEPRRSYRVTWSPAQIVALVLGLFYFVTILGCHNTNM